MKSLLKITALLIPVVGLVIFLFAKWDLSNLDALFEPIKPGETLDVPFSLVPQDWYSLHFCLPETPTQSDSEMRELWVQANQRDPIHYRGQIVDDQGLVWASFDDSTGGWMIGTGSAGSNPVIQCAYAFPNRPDDGFYLNTWTKYRLQLEISTQAALFENQSLYVVISGFRNHGYNALGYWLLYAILAVVWVLILLALLVTFLVGRWKTTRRIRCQGQD